jgi:hypothetical protein
MQLELNRTAEASSEPAFGFYDEQSGIFVTDPYVSSSNLFAVDPTQEYGLSADDLEWLSMMNAVYDCRHEEILIQHGFIIEDMGKVYGNGWHGQYRWMHSEGSFQDDDTSFSRTDAIRRAWAFYMDTDNMIRHFQPAVEKYF